jgi:deoxyribose-phosphate aldolase
MKLNRYIDHTILKPDATQAQVIQICSEAREYGFAAVCVNPVHAALMCRELKGSAVTPCVVVGFPLGAVPSKTKAFEALDAVSHGVREIDMVMNVGALKDGRHNVVRDDIKTVVDAVSDHAHVKVILECCLLARDEIIKACELAMEAGAHFVKTSTGFSTGGATVEDIKLMRATVGENAGVKASGGIKTRADAEALIAAGATRIGASAGIAIVSED